MVLSFEEACKTVGAHNSPIWENVARAHGGSISGKALRQEYKDEFERKFRNRELDYLSLIHIFFCIKHTKSNFQSQWGGKKDVYKRQALTCPKPRWLSCRPRTVSVMNVIIRDCFLMRVIVRYETRSQD